jgi:hypothetical protein
LKVKWRKSPKVLIDEIKSKLSITENSGIAIYGESESLFDALYEKLEHPYTLNQDLLFDIFRGALIDTFSENRLAKDDLLLKKFKDRCSKKSHDCQSYTLITSISLRNLYSPKRRRVNECFLSFHKEVPKKYKKEREAILLKYSNLELKEQDSFLFSCVTVDAPNAATAILKAGETLDLIRSLWQIGFRKTIHMGSSVSRVIIFPYLRNKLIAVFESCRSL